MNRLQKNGPMLRLLQKTQTALQKSILDKASPELIRCICDCAHNILHRKVSILLITKKLNQHKNKLRKLADRKVALKNKKRLVKTGGFLPLLLSAVTSVISGALSSLAKREN